MIAAIPGGMLPSVKGTLTSLEAIPGDTTVCERNSVFTNFQQAPPRVIIEERPLPKTQISIVSCRVLTQLGAV